MVDVVSSTKSLIEGCLNAYNDFCTLKAECKSFRRLLTAVVDVLDDIEQQFQEGSLGNTALQRPMMLLRSAAGEGGEVLRKCTKTKKVLTLVFSKQMLGTLNKASQDVNQALLLLSASGVNIQGSISLQIDMVGKMVGHLQGQIQNNKHEVAEMVREVNREGCNDLAQAVAEKLVAMQVVGSVEDFKEQQNDIQQECERLRTLKVVYDQEILEAVRMLSLQDSQGAKPLPEQQHSSDVKPAPQQQHSSDVKPAPQQQHSSDVKPAPQQQQPPNVTAFLECPISREVMRDPVTLVDSGHTYDREHLCLSLLSHPDLEPLTGKRFDRPLAYTDNIFARSMIMQLKGDDFFKRYDDRSFQAKYKEAWQCLRNNSDRPSLNSSAGAPSAIPRQKDSLKKIFAHLFGSNESKVDEVKGKQLLDEEDESPVVLALKGLMHSPDHDFFLSTVKDQRRALSGIQRALESGLKQLADAGDSMAQFVYGQLSELGVGVEKDYGEAVRYYEAASNQGLGVGKCALGVMHYQGYGVMQDYSAALDLLEQAADHGVASARMLLGLMFKMGQGVSRDFVKSARWFRLAADQGDANALNILGLMYLNGQEGVTQNFTEAARLFQLAAKKGLAMASCNLGVMYHGYQGVPQDLPKAVHYFRVAADQGLAVAQYKLGEMHQNGMGVPKNYTEAARLYRLAADQGLAEAQFNLATLYSYGLGVPRDFSEANRLFQLAKRQQQTAMAQQSFGL